MAKYVSQNMGTSEALSPVISGLTNAVSKLADALNLQTSTLTDYTMTEVYISESDRYRIYEVDVDRKGWIATPEVVIKKNGVAISPATDNFVIDYLGGSIEFKGTRPTGSDTLTVTATYINNLSTALSNLSTGVTTLGEKVKGFKGYYNTLQALQDAVTNPTSGDFGIVLGTVNNIYLYNSNSTNWFPVNTTQDLSAYYTKSETDTLLGNKEPTISAQGSTATSDNYYYGGRKTWIELFGKIRGTVLTGLSTATATVISATDTILAALGKLQAQITANNTTLTNSIADVQSQVTAQGTTISALPTTYEKIRLQFENTTVPTSAFVADTTYSSKGFGYRAAIALTGVLANMTPDVVLDVADAVSGKFAPCAACYAGGVYIYASEVPSAAITIPTIICQKAVN